MTLAEGQLINSPFLPGPTRIKKVEQRAAFYRRIRDLTEEFPLRVRGSTALPPYLRPAACWRPSTSASLPWAARTSTPGTGTS